VLLNRDGLQLTYCTNIHAADGWDAVFGNLRRIAPQLKARLSPSRPFGLGLRLSAREARELLQPGHLDEFRSFLDAEGLYVAIINGFPYGHFHGTPVKAEVYAPDWRNDARVRYTLDLIEILSRLLPGTPASDGGVSTAPLSYKAWMRPDDDVGWETITRNIARVAEGLVRMRDERGTLIHLDIEPEPDCLLETTSETVEFFERRLLPEGSAPLAAGLGVGPDVARELLQEHVRVCFDCCHVSVEHEDPRAALAEYRRAGIHIGRVQLSSALDVRLPADTAEASQVAARLRPFADPVYLHQVVERRGAERRQFPDLDAALRDAPGGAAKDWRIHFHVPLFTSEYDGLGSTQRDVSTVLQAARETPFTNHLEIETYTWDVLPGDLKIDVVNSIVREYEWVLRQWEEHS
jgi:sugar phosphate isomerase/epimerase